MPFAILMALWEYKVITSGKGGFATPALLESYLNQLGTEEWEIVEFRTQPDNFLAFSGLARRLTQREWTLEAAASAAAKVEADKLRAEFAAKFQAGTTGADPAAGKDADSGGPTRDDTFRRPRDTEYDQDPYALDDSSTEEEAVPLEDQLPTFFEAVRPHMRRNQKGPGYSVGVEYLLKKFEMLEEDLNVAFKEIGFELPEDEDDKPVYIEYDGDIYWVNINRRGELWLNTREKPRAAFKVVKGNRITPETEQPEEVQPKEQQPPREQRRRDRDGRERDNPRRDSQVRENQTREAQSKEAQHSEKPAVPIDAPSESSEVASVAEANAPQAGPAQAQEPVRPSQKEAAPPQPLPTGHDLLTKLRPMMRRSRGGWSGTISYLSRAMRHTDADLMTALATIGLMPPATPGEKAPIVESSGFGYWLNKDGRGGMWINVRDARRLRHDEKSGKREEGATTSSEEAPSQGEQPAADVVATDAVAVVAESAPVTGIEQVSRVEPPQAEVPVAVTEIKAEPKPEPVPAPVDPDVDQPLAELEAAVRRLFPAEAERVDERGGDLHRLLRLANRQRAARATSAERK